MTEDYRAIDKLNQSSLKKILSSPLSYVRSKESQDSTESYFVFGKVVDVLMLSPNDFDKEFLVTNVPEISDTLKLLCDYVINYCIESELKLNLDDPKVESIIIDAFETHNYQNNWGNEAKIKNFKKNCTDYIKVIQQCEGKTIVSKEDYNKALTCKAALLSDPRTASYFKYIGKPTKDVEVDTHKRIEFEHLGFECKGELDGLVIDHKNKKIVPFDLKTTSQLVTMFPYQFWKLRYDFQAAFYMQGLKENVDINNLVTDGYTLENFRFVVVETDCHSSPLIFETSEEVLNIGKYGGTLSSGKKVEGFEAAIERYKFHSNIGEWDYPMEYYNGNLKIEI